MAKGFGRGGFPGGANMNSLMQQAQKMQKDMQQAQEEIAKTVVEASVGGGMVSLKMNGEHQITEIIIKPEAVDPDDVEMLQDLMLAAFNEATGKIQALSEEKMGRFGQMGMGF